MGIILPQKVKGYLLYYYVEGLGFRDQDLGFRRFRGSQSPLKGIGFRIYGLGSWVWGLPIVSIVVPFFWFNQPYVWDPTR